MRRITPVILALALLAACRPDNINAGSSDAHDVQAYVPVYAQVNNLPAVGVEAVRATNKAGKIYAYGSYIFQNELNEGIHIIDNAIQGQPKKIAFLRIPYNTELAVRGNYIYANRLNDLLVINVQNPQQPTIVKTIDNAFPLINQQHPPASGYFICPDPAKGIVVDWELKNVDHAKCRR
jgi:hypothetical protein